MGDSVIDLAFLEAEGLLSPGAEPVFHEAGINSFLALGSDTWSQTRARLIDLFSADGDPVLRENGSLAKRTLYKILNCSAKMRNPL